VRVVALTNQWPRPSQPYCGIVVVRQVESLRRAGTNVDVIVISGTLRSYLRAALQVLALNLRPGRAHVLHAHTGHSGILACLQLRYPVVLTYVGYDIDDQLEERGRVRRLVERAAFRPLSVLFAASIVQTARSADRLPRPGRHRVSVIPNGIDRKLFSPVPRAQARHQLGWGGEPIVLFAGDPERPVKRFGLAQQAVELARSSVPDLRLVVADHVPPDEMPLWMNAADVLLLTSISEGSPNVVKEAMACDLPVVSVDVGDVREVIAGTRHCRVCSAEPEDLERAIVDVIGALPDRSDGRQRTAWLDEDAVAGRLAEVYGLAQSRGPGILGFLPVRHPSRRAGA
jgi:teichuronic acid biosynthesis glycosyltransferase TuaC